MKPFDLAELQRLKEQNDVLTRTFRSAPEGALKEQLRFASGHAYSELLQYVVSHVEEIADSLQELQEIQIEIGILQRKGKLMLVDSENNPGEVTTDVYRPSWLPTIAKVLWRNFVSALESDNV